MQEGVQAINYTLDEGLIEFGTAMEDGDYERLFLITFFFNLKKKKMLLVGENFEIFLFSIFLELYRFWRVWKYLQKLKQCGKHWAKLLWKTKTFSLLKGKHLSSSNLHFEKWWCETWRPQLQGPLCRTRDSDFGNRSSTSDNAPTNKHLHATLLQ